MNNKIMLLLVLIVFSFVLISCGDDKSSQKDSTAKESEPEIVVNEKYLDSTYELRYNFPEGKKLSYKLTSVANTMQTVNEGDSTVTAEVNQQITYIFDINSLGKTGNNYKLNVNINSLHLKATYQDEVIEYNSDNENDAASKRKFPEYASLPNSPYTVIVDPEGKIQDVTDFENIIDKYLEVQNVPAIDDEQRDELRLQMKEGAVKPLTQQLFKHLPGNKVGIDSTWEHTYDSGMGVFKLINTAESKFVNINEDQGDKIARIKVGLKVKVEGEGDVSENGINYSFSEPKVTGDGESYFNIDKGYLVKAETSTRIEMDLAVSGNDPQQGIINASRLDITENKNYVELLSSEK